MNVGVSFENCKLLAANVDTSALLVPLPLGVTVRGKTNSDVEAAAAAATAVGGAGADAADIPVSGTGKNVLVLALETPLLLLPVPVLAPTYGKYIEDDESNSPSFEASAVTIGGAEDDGGAGVDAACEVAAISADINDADDGIIELYCCCCWADCEVEGPCWCCCCSCCWYRSGWTTRVRPASTPPPPPPPAYVA